MAKSNRTLPDKIEYAKLEDLRLDGLNPRLGRERVKKGLSQDQVLEIMRDWTLEELGTSFCESGFWPQEALIVVREKLGKADALVVVEGNRRLAALKFIARAVAGGEASKTWSEIAEGVPPKRLRELLEKIPYMLMPDRQSVKSYLGFRHVTGIKEWKPAEKAQFIVELIEEDRLTYDEVRKRIGSKLPIVRQNYISYKLLLQMEQHDEDVDVERVEERFSVLYLSLRTEGARSYLNIDIEADPKAARRPVPPARLKQLANFARWLFGDDKHEPLFTDSRRVDDFGRILLKERAVEYLERTDQPSFDVARRMAGVAEAEVAKHIERAADEAEEALRAAHNYKSSSRVETAVGRLAPDAVELARLFPAVLDKLRKEIQ